jgi:hypothetical protein
MNLNITERPHTTNTQLTSNNMVKTESFSSEMRSKPRTPIFNSAYYWSLSQRMSSKNK